MNHNKTTRRLAGRVIAFGSIGLMAGLPLAASSYAGQASAAAARDGTSAIVEICIQENGRWGCFERLERLAVEINASREHMGPKGTMWSDYLRGYVSDLLELAPAKDMFDACPMTRKDECAARMIGFGYDRATLLSLSTQD